MLYTQLLIPSLLFCNKCIKSLTNIYCRAVLEFGTTLLHYTTTHVNPNCDEMRILLEKNHFIRTYRHSTVIRDSNNTNILFSMRYKTEFKTQIKHDKILFTCTKF